MAKAKIYRAPWNSEVLISAKQLEIYNCDSRYLLVCGPRNTGKSVGVQHRVIRHLWEVPNALFALVTKTVKVGKEGGVWIELIRDVMPQWLGLTSERTNLPLEYLSESRGIPGPKTDPTTRTGSFAIRNWWGTESKLVHLSLDNTEEVEAKFKGTKFSGIWFSELSEFDDPNVFVQSIQSLRLGDERNQQLIADTNPSKEGEDSWIYDYWYRQPHQKDHPQPLFQQQLKLIEVFLHDNPFLTEFKLQELKGSNANLNEADRARNVEGKWVKGTGMSGKYFAPHIDPATHFIEPAIDIDPATVELFAGWDIGDVNHAVVLLERRIINDLSHWMVLDEVVSIKEELSTEELTWKVLAKMHQIETFYQRNFIWKHWSDSTAQESYRASADTYDADVVLKASNGVIELAPVMKPQDSVPTGIKIMKMLLRSKRLFVGRNCPKVIEMLSDLSEGKKKPVDDGPLKHPFDASRYVLYMEERAAVMANEPVKGVDRMAIIGV